MLVHNFISFLVSEPTEYMQIYVCDRNYTRHRLKLLQNMIIKCCMQQHKKSKVISITFI